jgi:hypothetical protein
MMKISVIRSRWAAAALAFALAFGVWMLLANQRSHAVAAARLHHTHATAPSSSGARKPLLVRPKAVRDKIAKLNRVLETCLAGHGVSRESLPEGGYMYRSNARVDAACAGQRHAIDAYINSDAYHASDAAARRLLEQFWDCFNRLPARTEAAIESCRVEASNPQ